MKNNYENCIYNEQWDNGGNYLRTSPQYILMYGDIIVSKNFIDNTKIKIIEWDGILYYHESVNDTVTEFRKIGRI